MLERGSIDKPLTFDIGLIQLSFIPVYSPNTCNISVKLHEGLHFSAFLRYCRNLRHINPLIESSLKFPKDPYPTQADDLNHIELLHTSGCHYDCIGTEDEALPPLTLPNIKIFPNNNYQYTVLYKTTQYTDKTQSHYCMPLTLTI